MVEYRELMRMLAAVSLLLEDDDLPIAPDPLKSSQLLGYEALQIVIADMLDLCCVSLRPAHRARVLNVLRRIRRSFAGAGGSITDAICTPVVCSIPAFSPFDYRDSVAVIQAAAEFSGLCPIKHREPDAGMGAAELSPEFVMNVLKWLENQAKAQRIRVVLFPEYTATSDLVPQVVRWTKRRAPDDTLLILPVEHLSLREYAALVARCQQLSPMCFRWFGLKEMFSRNISDNGAVVNCALVLAKDSAGTTQGFLQPKLFPAFAELDNLVLGRRFFLFRLGGQQDCGTWFVVLICFDVLGAQGPRDFCSSLVHVCSLLEEHSWTHQNQETLDWVFVPELNPKPDYPHYYSRLQTFCEEGGAESCVFLFASASFTESFDRAVIAFDREKSGSFGNSRVAMCRDGDPTLETRKYRISPDDVSRTFEPYSSTGNIKGALSWYGLKSAEPFLWLIPFEKLRPTGDACHVSENEPTTE